MDKVYLVESDWDNGMDYDLHQSSEKLEGIFSTYEKAEEFVLNKISEESWESYAYDIWKDLYSFERVWDEETEEYSVFTITEVVVQ